MPALFQIVSLIVTAALGWLGFMTAGAGAPSEAAQVDQLFSAWDKPGSPGCAVAVMQEGRIVHERGYGLADLDHDVRITPTTVFHVASMSKQFTAASILLLAREGNLSLDDQARQYVPELPDFGVPITLRHLMHHTSGLRDQWDLLTLAGWRYSLDLITDADVLAVLSRQKKLNFQPGEKHLYSNTGYTLLAQVVKRISGRSLRAFTEDRLFAPLGMLHTHFRDNHAEIVKEMAYGYAPSRDGINLSVPNFDTVGATSLLTTVEDLALWDENFYTARIGGRALIDQLQERGHLNDGTQLNYAAGLVIGTYRGLNIVEHGGVDAGYRANLIRFPDQHFSVALLCNLASIDPAALSRRIADIYLKPALSEAAPPVVVPASLPSSERMEKWTGLYVQSDEGERVMRVRFRDGRLQSGLDVDGFTADLEAVNESRFRSVRFPQTEFAFAGAEDGSPCTLTSYTNGKMEHRYARVEPYKPSAAQLQEFAGLYRSEEVDMPYTVSAGDGGLLVRSLKSKDVPLLPVSTDLFNGKGYRVRFLRDPGGRVVAAMLNTARVFNFRFDRAP